ncbi:MAG: GLUG motif-containing protein, partial [Pseudomonadota bacterium]
TDFTIAATGGDITGTTLGANLAGGNVTITAPGTGTTGNGDIFVNDPVTWGCTNAAGCALTLNAWRNIYINQDITGTVINGTPQLFLMYGQGAATAGNTADYFLGTGAQIFLPAGLNFHTTLGNTAGAQIDYTVITALGTQGSTTGTDLQGMIPTGNYVLGADIDASLTSLDTGWNAAGGFAPVGSFTGRFDGLGHTISGLFINRPATNQVGLFGITSAASIRNVGLLNANITGNSYVGGLAGYFFDGSISNSYVQTSTITGTGGLVGALAGYDISGTIAHSHATGNVITGNDSVGGLVGNYAFGAIIDSHADSGNVVGTSNAGALVGYNGGGTITNSHYAIDGANALTVNGLNVLMRGGYLQCPVC